MGHDKFGIYSGVYMPDKNQLQSIRESIVSKPKEFEKILKAKKFKTTWGEIQGEKNKRIPKEFQESKTIKAGKEKPYKFILIKDVSNKK